MSKWEKIGMGLFVGVPFVMMLFSFGLVAYHVPKAGAELRAYRERDRIEAAIRNACAEPTPAGGIAPLWNGEMAR